MLEYVKFFFKFCFAFIIIGYMIYTDRLDLAVVKSGFLQPNYLTAAFLLLLLGSCIAIYRWNMLLKGQNIIMNFSNIVRYSFIGMFFNSTMPGVVSGDVIKAWYVVADRPKGQKKTPVLTTIVLDRFIGLFGLIMVSAASMLLFWTKIWSMQELHSVVTINLILFSCVLLFFTYVMFSTMPPLKHLRAKMNRFAGSKLGDLFLRVYDTWLEYRQHPKILFGSLACSFLTHSCVVGAVILSSMAIGESSLPIYQYFLIAPLGLLCIALPLSPAGLGVGHIAFAALFTLAGSKLGAEIFTLFITVQIIVNCIGIIFYIQIPKPQKPVEDTL